MKLSRINLNLSYQELPFKIPDIAIHQVWHAQFDNDSSHRWLCRVIKSILQDRFAISIFPSAGGIGFSERLVPMGS